RHPSRRVGRGRGHARRRGDLRRARRRAPGDDVRLRVTRREDDPLLEAGTALASCRGARILANLAVVPAYDRGDSCPGASIWRAGALPRRGETIQTDLTRM